ncbi:MAG: hypothetical protein HYW49_06110 [Deltaproteobacteria bacterium]|nr:hypothetical protein [Deltaproteobacteria bacterium]
MKKLLIVLSLGAALGLSACQAILQNPTTPDGRVAIAYKALQDNDENEWTFSFTGPMITRYGSEESMDEVRARLAVYEEKEISDAVLTKTVRDKEGRDRVRVYDIKVTGKKDSNSGRSVIYDITVTCTIEEYDETFGIEKTRPCYITGMR